MDISVNQQIAQKLREAADLLSAQGANPFRVAAYRKAADTVEGLNRDLAHILEKEGLEGLIALPAIGRSISSAIREMVTSGRWSQLERLRGTLDAGALLQTVPGIGAVLADHIHDDLHIDTLEQLEAAAWDGRLQSLPGIGKRRLQGIRASLSSMLERTRRRDARGADAGHGGGPDVQILLKIDKEYRELAEAGKLPTIAPRRFNPDGEAWLPVLHNQRDHWHFTVLYSNTALAHKLDRVRDWVVIYFFADDGEEGQHTVVTETRGALQGHRVVRGRESECRALYAKTAAR
ncbi:MAG: helix-hairpin-helix domain-containing protein [Gammaproteobacteria bacterium]